eukprot:Gb_01227 [translate_table: standard]
MNRVMSRLRRIFELKKMSKRKVEENLAALQNVGLREFFLVPNLFYEVSVVVDPVKMVPNGPKKKRTIIAQQHCRKPTDFTSSGIRIEGLRDKTTRRITKLMNESTPYKSLRSTQASLVLHAYYLYRIAIALVQGNSVVGVVEKEEAIKPSVMTPSHGQRSELRQIEDAEERRRKKGKFPMVEEDVVHDTPEVRPQPSSKKEITRCKNQVPILPLLDYLTNMFPLEWPESILDGFILLNYEDHWKVFEEGLEKECELFNHEQWRSTFTTNVI